MSTELPWDEPTGHNKEYMAWINRKLNRTPWIKIDNRPLGLLVFCCVNLFQHFSRTSGRFILSLGTHHRQAHMHAHACTHAHMHACMHTVQFSVTGSKSTVLYFFVGVNFQ